MTVDALAAQCGIDADGLRRTVQRFNAFASTGRDQDFGRGDSAYDRLYGDPRVRPNPNLGPVDRPPFYAVQIWAGDLDTKGGLLTDEHARVLREEGTPSPACTRQATPRRPSWAAPTPDQARPSAPQRRSPISVPGTSPNNHSRNRRPSTSISGRIPSSGRGSHQAARPSRDITAGTIVIRTTNASTRTPNTSAKPIDLTSTWSQRRHAALGDGLPLERALLVHREGDPVEEGIKVAALSRVGVNPQDAAAGDCRHQDDGQRQRADSPPRPNPTSSMRPHRPTRRRRPLGRAHRPA
jgi:hypothetical protein